MKKFLILSFLILFFAEIGFSATCSIDDAKAFSKDNKLYGLKRSSNDEIIVNPKYKKVIVVGKGGWLIQQKNQKFGYIDNCGNILIKPKYERAERLFDKWVKLGNLHDYGLYDEYGTTIVPPEFSLIEPMFGKRFLTNKNNKYGIYGADGREILSNRYDYIYMPNPYEIRIKYNNTWYEISKNNQKNEIVLSDEFFDQADVLSKKDRGFLYVTGINASYGIVTATDYTLKILSTLSTAYEDTIDELTLSKGVEAVPILITFSWLPKFPVTYAKKYGQNIAKPNNSPLSNVRSELREQVK